jgi:hypothetical protein
VVSSKNHLPVSNREPIYVYTHCAIVTNRRGKKNQKGPMSEMGIKDPKREMHNKKQKKGPEAEMGSKGAKKS